MLLFSHLDLIMIHDLDPEGISFFFPKEGRDGEKVSKGVRVKEF